MINKELSKQYSSKNVSYFSNQRIDVINILPKKEFKNVLEIGAGSGETLLLLKEIGAAQNIYGVELMNIPNSSQTSNQFEKFIISDITEKKLDLSANYFDLIICADVLEHLVDPWDILNYLKKFLNKNGILVICCPNIREYMSMYNIFWKGDFKYADEGVLDKTHLRFFCKKNLISMVQDTGFTIQKISPNFYWTPRRNKLNKLTFGLFSNFLTPQYLMICKINE